MAKEAGCGVCQPARGVRTAGKGAAAQHRTSVREQASWVMVKSGPPGTATAGLFLARPARARPGRAQDGRDGCMCRVAGSKLGRQPCRDYITARQAEQVPVAALDFRAPVAADAVPGPGGWDSWLYDRFRLCGFV
jgi:hypothetical protein